MEACLEFQFERIVADAGYESEENLVFLRDKEIKAYIKPSNYEQLGTKKFSQEIGKKENMAYDLSLIHIYLNEQQATDLLKNSVKQYGESAEMVQALLNQQQQP